MASHYPLVSLIVSNLNGMNLNILADCLKSVMASTYKNWELIVVDNNSNDSSVEFVKKLFKGKKNCHLIQNPVNMYSQGLNLGAKAAKGEFLAYFNNDVAIPKGYFETMVKQFETYPNVAIAQAKLVNYFDRKKIDSAGETMDIYGNPITIGAGDADQGQFDQSEDILSCSGSACMIRRSVFEKLGGYDDDYGIGYEDMDLALRARRMGYAVKRFSKVVVFHKRASTDLAAFVRIKVKWHFNKNRLATMLKNYPPMLLVRALPVTIVLYIGIGFYEWFVRKNWQIGWVRFTAMGWAAEHLGDVLTKRQEIFDKGAKPLSLNDIGLFSPKSIRELFSDFVK